MSLLTNHGIIKFKAPQLMETVATTAAAGVSNPVAVTFSRAPKLGELIILIAIANNSITITTPSGFTVKQNVNSGTVATRLMYKVATSSESSSYSVTFSGTSDERNVIGYLVSSINSASVFGTDQQKIQAAAVSSPQNIFTGSVAFTQGQLLIGLCKFVGAARTSNTLSDSLTIDHQLPSSTAKLLGAHRLFVSPATINPQWGWGGGGAAAFVTNFCVINPPATN